MTALVNDLKKVQDALGGGYLSAFPLEHFERLQALRPVWAPFYVVRGLGDACRKRPGACTYINFAWMYARVTMTLRLVYPSCKTVMKRSNLARP